MTEVRHQVTTADRAAMTAMRAKLAAAPIQVTRESYDALLERVPPAGSVAYSEGEVGGVPGVWCTPKAHRASDALLYLHGGVFVFGSTCVAGRRAAPPERVHPVRFKVMPQGNGARKGGLR